MSKQIDFDFINFIEVNENDKTHLIEFIAVYQTAINNFIEAIERRKKAKYRYYFDALMSIDNQISVTKSDMANFISLINSERQDNIKVNILIKEKLMYYIAKKASERRYTTNNYFKVDFILKYLSIKSYERQEVTHIIYSFAIEEVKRRQQFDIY